MYCRRPGRYASSESGKFMTLVQSMIPGLSLYDQAVEDDKYRKEKMAGQWGNSWQCNVVLNPIAHSI